MSSNKQADASIADSFEMLSRAGFAARGLVYILIGFFALFGGQVESSSDALEFLRNQAFGRILVAVVGVGLLGYGAWRLTGAWYDLEGEGQDGKGRIKRAAHALSGVAYLLLSIIAFALALSISFGSGSQSGAEQATGIALSVPGGRYLVMAVGVGFILAGLFQITKGARDQHMDEVTASSAPQTFLTWLGRIGHVARGIVFTIIGWFLIRAGQAASAEETRGPGEALDALIGWPSMALAAGLLLFGLFSMLLAYYRRINDDDIRAQLRELGT